MGFKETLANAAHLAKDHPFAAAAIGVGTVAVAAPALVATPALGAGGFAASGIQAGSLAASAQSGIGSVVGPSLFSTLQSAAMGGYGVSIVHGAVQGAGVMLFGSGGLAAWRKKGGASDTEAEAEGKDEKDGKRGEEDDEGKEVAKPRL